jgi:hypothetical protein
MYPKPTPTNLFMVYLADYVIPDCKVTSGLQIGRHVEGSGPGIILGTNPEIILQSI